MVPSGDLTACAVPASGFLLVLGRDPPLQQPRELTLYPAPPTSLDACAGSPAVRITGLCRHVIAAGHLPGGLRKTWHLEKSLECTAGTLRKNIGRARLLADFSTVLRVCCIYFLLSVILCLPANVLE